MGKKAPAFYAVRNGRKPGIYRDWKETESQVSGFKGGVYQKFATEREALAWMKGTMLTKEVNSIASGSKIRAGDGPEPQDKKKLKKTIEDPNARLVYCDGSALGNGKPGSVAGIGVFWPAGDALSLAERVPGHLQTNSRAEMYALARILEDDPTPSMPLTVCTDSEYVINVFSLWINAWMRKDWKTSTGTAVSHKDLILYVLALISSRMPAGSIEKTGNITFRKVKAHVGIPANEEADRLAKLGASMVAVEERDLVKATANLKRRLEEKNIKGVEEFEFIIDDDDLYSMEELKEMESKQEF